MVRPRLSAKHYWPVDCHGDASSQAGRLESIDCILQNDSDWDWTENHLDLDPSMWELVLSVSSRSLGHTSVSRLFRELIIPLRG